LTGGADAESTRIRAAFNDSVAKIRAQGYRSAVENEQIAERQVKATEAIAKLKSQYEAERSEMLWSARVEIFGQAPRDPLQRVSRRQASQEARSLTNDPVAAHAILAAAADGDSEMVRAIARVAIDLEWPATLAAWSTIPDERLAAEHAATLHRLQSEERSLERRLLNSMRFSEAKVPNAT
jgi:hypothetical protein